MIAIGPTQRTVLKWVGYVALALTTLIFALHYTFPYHRVKDKLVAALSTKYDVTIGEAGPGWIPGHMVLEDMKLATRPEREDQKPTTLEIERVEVNLGVFALLGGDYDLEFDADVGDGSISGAVSYGAGGMRVELDTTGLPLETVPGVDSIAGGAPIKGALDAKVRLTLPNHKWKEAYGSISLACTGCVMGDGVAKMRPTAPKARNAFSDAGFTLPPTRLGSVTGRIKVKKGTACIDELESKSPDGELYLEGGIRFDDPFTRSHAQLYARYKVSEEYMTRNEAMGTVIRGAPTAARRSDGYLGFYARDPVNALWWKPGAANPAPMRECGMAGGDALADKDTKRAKPARKPKDRVKAGAGVTAVAPAPAPAPQPDQPIDTTPDKGTPNPADTGRSVTPQNVVNIDPSRPPIAREGGGDHPDDAPNTPPSDEEKAAAGIEEGQPEPAHDTDPDQPQQPQDPDPNAPQPEQPEQ